MKERDDFTDLKMELNTDQRNYPMKTEHQRLISKPDFDGENLLSRWQNYFDEIDR